MARVERLREAIRQHVPAWMQTGCVQEVYRDGVSRLETVSFPDVKWNELEIVADTESPIRLRGKQSFGVFWRQQAQASRFKSRRGDQGTLTVSFWLSVESALPMITAERMKAILVHYLNEDEFRIGTGLADFYWQGAGDAALEDEGLYQFDYSWQAVLI